MDNTLNFVLSSMDVYASKEISLRAKCDPNITNLSFGEPNFGLLDCLLLDIVDIDLNKTASLDSAKKYEDSKGSMELWESILHWYLSRYNLEVYPKTEIIITHGGVEAIVLSILCLTEIGDSVVISDPSYMLYKRTIMTLGRKPIYIHRPSTTFEYKNTLESGKEQLSEFYSSKIIIVNLPKILLDIL